MESLRRFQGALHGAKARSFQGEHKAVIVSQWSFSWPLVSLRTSSALVFTAGSSGVSFIFTGMDVWPVLHLWFWKYSQLLPTFLLSSWDIWFKCSPKHQHNSRSMIWQRNIWLGDMVHYERSDDISESNTVRYNLNTVHTEHKHTQTMNRDYEGGVTSVQIELKMISFNNFSIFNNAIVQPKPVHQHWNLVLCKWVVNWTVQMRGSSTAQSKTGQECRNVFSSLVWICHSLLFLQTRSEEKPLIMSVVAKSAVIQWKEDDDWRSWICKPATNCWHDAHIFLHIILWYCNWQGTIQTDILGYENKC